ncbi:hypothetical protein CYMTET_16765, partial [Cymbomonas tetramitiformis]
PPASKGFLIPVELTLRLPPAPVYTQRSPGLSQHTEPQLFERRCEVAAGLWFEWCGDACSERCCEVAAGLGGLSGCGDACSERRLGVETPARGAVSFKLDSGFSACGDACSERRCELEEEEGILLHSHLFRNIFYLSMATMGISVPLLALYVFVRMSPPVQMVQPVPSSLQSTAAGSGVAALHVQNAIREQIVPGGGMMARIGDGLAGMIYGFKSRVSLSNPTLPVTSRSLPPPSGLGSGEEQRLADLAGNAWNPLQPKTYQTGLQAFGGANNSTMERIRQLEQENYRLRTMEEDDRRSSRLAELQSENERLRILKTRKEQRGNFNW